MEWSNTPKQTANANVNLVDCHKNVSTLSIPSASSSTSSPPSGTLSFESVSPPSPPINSNNNSLNLSNFSINPQSPNNLGMNKPPKNNMNTNMNMNMNNSPTKPSMPTMHQLSPMALNSMTMNINNINMNMNMNQNRNNNAFPAMRNGMQTSMSLPMPIPISMPMPNNINNIMPTITTVPTSPNIKNKKIAAKAKQESNRMNQQLMNKLSAQQQMMMNPASMTMEMNMNLKQQQLMQQQMMQRQMLQQQMMMQQQQMAQQNMTQQNMFNNQFNNMPTNTLNAIGRDTQNKFALRETRSMKYLHQISQLNKAKKMYEDELRKLKSLGALSRNYKEPSFPDLTGVIPPNNDSPASSASSGSPSASMWTTSPIEVAPSADSVSPPQQIENNKQYKAKKEDALEAKEEEEEEDQQPTPADYVIKGNSNQNKNNEEKKVNTKENDIVTIVGGRVVFIPPVHPPTPTNNDDDNNNEETKSNDPIPSSVQAPPSLASSTSIDTSKFLSGLNGFGSLNNVKLPDLTSLRSYSISNGFSFRQPTAERCNLRSSRLKRSRTTFEPRGHSSKKVKSSSRGLKGGLRERTKSKENKTTLLTLNDISKNDVHVQRGVRKMLRNVSLMRKRSLSCASLSSVKE